MAQLGPEGEDLVMQAYIGKELFDKGAAKGFEKGLVQGRQKGRQEGREQERQESIFRMFELRLGRKLLDGEREVLIERLRDLGPDRLTDMVLKATDIETLESWLRDPS